MEVLETQFSEVKLLNPTRFSDTRGFFSELFNAARFESAIGTSLGFVQDNVSYSRHPGTIRGIHFQSPPYAQDKLVCVLRGAVIDVAVDLRIGSPTFGEHVSRRLDAENGLQLFVPVGFGHGLCTLEPDTVVLYKVSATYSPEHDLGVKWDDPDLGIAWPVSTAEAIVSQKDLDQPRLRDLPVHFRFNDY